MNERNTPNPTWQAIGNGGLWPSENAGGNRPDFTGRLEIEGLGEVRLAAWIRDRDGQRYLSLAASRRADGNTPEQTAPSASVWDRLTQGGAQPPASAASSEHRDEACRADHHRPEERDSDLPF